MTSSIRMIKFLWNTHKISMPTFFMIMVLTAFAIRWRAFNIWGIPEGPKPFLDLYSLLFLYIIEFAALVAYLGYLLNTSRLTGWFNTLPFSHKNFTFLPIIFILSAGLLAHVVIPWGAYNTGLSLFLYVIPILVFLNLKHSRNYFLGVITATLLIVGIAMGWAYVIYWWSVFQPKLGIELLTIVCSIGLLFLLFRKEKMVISIILIFLLSLNFIELGLRSIRKPNTFKAVISDLKFYPSKMAIANFIKITQDKAFWQQDDQYAQPEYIDLLSQNYTNNYLSSQQKLNFFKNVKANRNKFDPLDDSKIKNNNKVNVFPTPDFQFYRLGKYVFGLKNVDEGFETYLYESWQDSDLYCNLLPSRRSRRYIETIISSRWCFGKQMDSSLFKQYNPVKKGTFEKAMNDILTSAFSDQKLNTRMRLMSSFRSDWDLFGSDAFDETYFVEKPITLKEVNQFNNIRYQKLNPILNKWLKLSNTEIWEKILSDGFKSDHKKNVSLFLCNLLTYGCEIGFYESVTRPLSFSQAIQMVWQMGAPFDRKSAFKYYVANTVGDRESWGQLINRLNADE